MSLPGTWPGARTDERELIRRLRAGEESAFTEIVRRYRPRLLAFSRRLLAGRSPNAEDVVQESLLRLGRRGSWERVRTQFNATGWLPQRVTCG